jgi:hypothetical protein
MFKPQIKSQLTIISKSLLELYKYSKSNISNDESLELRDLSLDLWNKLEQYSVKYIKNWHSQDIGTV